MDRKLFVFDIGGVVVFHPSVMEGFCKRYNLDIAKVSRDWMMYSKPMMDGFCGPEIMYRMFEHKYNIDLTGDDVMMTYYYPKANGPMIEIINELRANGHRVVSGSNTYAGHWEYCKAMESRPLACFDKLYASHEIHYTKPDEEFYRYILKEEGFRPEDSFFTDDYKVNIETAAGIGMNTFQYSRNDEEFRAFLKPYLS
ncbi:MAG: HAD-IA family hydrolase [Spirochaetales bacterium]|nr:HAD-IA family hydrolase [Spirochaetales bacterium]